MESYQNVGDPRVRYSCGHVKRKCVNDEHSILCRRGIVGDTVTCAALALSLAREALCLERILACCKKAKPCLGASGMRGKEEVPSRDPRASSGSQGPGSRPRCRMWDRVVYAVGCPGPKVYRTTRGWATDDEVESLWGGTRGRHADPPCSIQFGWQTSPFRHCEAQRQFRWQQEAIKNGS